MNMNRTVWRAGCKLTRSLQCVRSTKGCPAPQVLLEWALGADGDPGGAEMRPIAAVRRVVGIISCSPANVRKRPEQVKPRCTPSSVETEPADPSFLSSFFLGLPRSHSGLFSRAALDVAGSTAGWTRLCGHTRCTVSRAASPLRPREGLCHAPRVLGALPGERQGRWATCSCLGHRGRAKEAGPVPHPEWPTNANEAREEGGGEAQSGALGP